MAETETTGLVTVDPETAQKAADILSLIADYEDEVDTVVSLPEQDASVQQKPAIASLEEQIAAAQNAQTEPVQPIDKPSQLDSVKSEVNTTPKEVSPQTSTHQEIDEQAEALQLQLDRAKQLRSENATAATVETIPPPVQDRQQTADLTNVLNEIKSELNTATAQRNLFADQLNSVVSRINKLETTKPGIQTQPSGQVDFENLHAKLSNAGNILNEALTAQMELAREVKAIKTHIAYTNRAPGPNTFVEQQQNGYVGFAPQSPPQYQPVSAERDMLVAELAVVKDRLGKLEYTKTSVNTQQSGVVTSLQGKLDETSRNNEILNAQIQELVDLLEKSNSDRYALETDLIVANKTINDLHANIPPLPQEGRIADHVKQITELRAKVVSQTAKLTKAHHELQQEIAQRRKTEQMLKGISKRFQHNIIPKVQ